MGSSIPSTIIADPRPVPSPRNSIRPPLKLPSACIAASLSIFTGQPKALLKSNLIHPPPRLCGSRSGCPLMMGPGYPRDTRSNFQSFTHSLTTRTILPAVIVGPDGILRGSFCPVASILMFVPPTSTTRTLGVFAASTLFIAAICTLSISVVPRIPRGYGFFSPIGKGIPEGRRKSQNCHSEAPIPIGAEESQRQIVQSLNGGCFSPASAPQRFVPRQPDHSDRDNALGEYHTLPDSLPRLHRGLLTSSAARLRGVALKGSQPFTCDRNARRSAMAHLSGGEQSARFAELCTVARKVLPQISCEIRVLRERSTEGKNESQSDIRWCRRNQLFLGSCERSGAILQSDPLDQEGPNSDRAARREPRPEQKARIAVAGHPAAAHQPQRRLPGVQEPQRLRRGPPRQPQPENQVRLLEVGRHRRAAQRQCLRLQSARER